MLRTTKEIYGFEEFCLDISERLLRRGSQRIPLSEKAFQTLCVLVRKAGQLVEKDELMREVWPDSIVEENNLDKHISALRHVFDEKRFERKFIETVRGHGYRFIADVKKIENESAEMAGESVDLTAEPVKIPISAPYFETRQTGKLLSVAAWRKKKNISSDETHLADLRLVEEKNDEPEQTTHLKNHFPFQNKERRFWLAMNLSVLLILVAIYGGWRYFEAWKNRAPIIFQAGHLRRITTDGQTETAVISPDGKYLVYEMGKSGQSSLWIQHIPTGSNFQLVAPAAKNYRGLAFSPDDNYVFYSVGENNTNEGGTLYQIPVLGGSSKKILENIYSAVSFSPDGKQFVFLRVNNEKNERAIIVADVDGTHERSLAVRQRPNFFAGDPSWSPDGTAIACHSASAEGGLHYDILLIHVADGIVENLLRQGWPQIYRLTWIPDGKSLLVLARDEVTSPQQIWQVFYPSGEKRKVTNDFYNYNAVSVTSDARLISAVVYEQFSHIWTMDEKDVSSLKQLTEGANKFDGANGMVWRPDNSIVFGTRASRGDEIWRIAADGRDLQKISNSKNGGMTVSPDGSLIIFQELKDGTTGLWRSDPDGNDRRRLTTGDDRFPNFTPDGRWILFTRFGQQTHLWKVSVEGGDPEQLTGDFNFATSSAVSPDGEQVAFTFSGTPLDPKESGIAVMSLGDGNVVKKFILPLQSGKTYMRDTLQWSPDGRSINFPAVVGGVSNIWRQPIAGGNPISITDFKEGRIFNYAFSANGKNLALSRGAIYEDVVLIENVK